MTQRLPTPGGDKDDWGIILNGFLSVAHNTDGTLQQSAITQSGGVTTINGQTTTTGSVTLTAADIGAVELGGDLGGSTTNPVITKLQGTNVNAATPAPNQVLAYNGTSAAWVPSTVTSTTVNDATYLAPGIVQLAGDLGGGTSGSATAPQVTSTHLNSPLPVNQGGTGQSTPQAAMNTLAGTQAAGKYLRSDGNNTTLATIQADDIPTLNQNTTGNAATATLADTVNTVPVLTGDITTNGTTNQTTLTNTTNVENIISSNNSVTSKAPLASPIFTGTVTTPALKVTSGTPVTGDVLTSDSGGNATWQAVPSAPVSSINGQTGAVTGLLETTNNLSELTASAATARSNITAAKSGANGDITSLSGLTTPLSIPQGGTGSSTQTFLTLGGDLGGTNVNAPLVESIQGVGISGTPGNGQILIASTSTSASWGTPNASNLGAAEVLTPTSIITSSNGSGNPYAATAGSFVPVDASSGSVVITLPLTPADKTRVAVKMINTTSSYTTTINTGGGSDVFNKTSGSTSLTLSLVNQGFMLQYTASSAIWYVQADDMPISGTPAAGQGIIATSSGTAAWTRREFNVMAFGAKGDGSTDDTTAINSCLTAAAAANGEVYFPPAPGGCYRTSGITVPGGVSRIYGSADLYRANGPSPVYLNGSVLAPLSTSGSNTVLMTIGVSGSGTVLNTNPHGLRVEGIGFLGTNPAGSAISGLWGAVVTDTSDVAFSYCRDLYCDPKSSVLGGGPANGTATGGWLQVLSSASGNGFSENCRIFFGASYGAGTFVYVDGLAASEGGSTDGRMIGCQLNTHYYGVRLGPNYAGTGGWAILECHFSSSNAQYHIYYGNAGSPWTLRVESCYFDVVGTYHILANTGRGLQAVGNYFRSSGNLVAINFGSGLNTSGRDPAALIVGNTFDLNKTTGTIGFVRFQGFTAANFASNGGGEYRSNLVHNHGSAMPSGWLGQFIGSDNAAISAASTATLDLSPGATLSA